MNPSSSSCHITSLQPIMKHFWGHFGWFKNKQAFISILSLTNPLPYLTCFTLTGAVGCSARPGAVSLALPCGGTTEQVTIHTGIDDRMWEGGAVQSIHPSITGSSRVTTLHRCSIKNKYIKSMKICHLIFLSEITFHYLVISLGTTGDS